MFTVVITEKGGGQRRLTFGEPEVTIGRVPGNDVVLPKGNVSKRHSRIVLKDNRFIVVDLKSTNGTYVNGRKITSPLVVKEGDKIYIGDFVLTLEGDAMVGSEVGSMRPPSVIPKTEINAAERSSSGVPPLPSRAPDPLPEEPLPAVFRSELPAERSNVNGNHASPSIPPPAPTGVRRSPSVPPVIGGAEATGERAALEQTNVVAYAEEEAPAADRGLLSIPPNSAARSSPPGLRLAPPPVPGGTQSPLHLLMLRVARDFDVENADPGSRSDERRWQKAERVIQAKLNDLVSENAVKPTERNALAQAALNEAVGLGPLEQLLADPEVSQVVVERFDRLAVDRGRGLAPEAASFSSPEAVLALARRLAAAAGVGGTLPDTLDLPLPNGLHVTAVLGGNVSDGPIVSVRRRPTQLTGLASHKASGALDDKRHRAIQEALTARKSIWFVAPPSVALGPWLAGALSECPPSERVALFERAPEVALGQRSALCLRLGGVPFATLIERVRHFRPERLVVHEPREDELGAVLAAFAQRHDGSLASISHKSAKEALTQLERAAGADVVLKAVALVVEIVPSAAGPRVANVYEPALDAAGTLTLKG